MRRMLKWLAGLAGVAAVARLLARRREQAPAPAPPPADDPAGELRRRLAEARGEEEPPGSVPASAEEPLSLDERRARVHERAHEAIDLMRDTDADPDDVA